MLSINKMNGIQTKSQKQKKEQLQQFPIWNQQVQDNQNKKTYYQPFMQSKNFLNQAFPIQKSERNPRQISTDEVKYGKSPMEDDPLSIMNYQRPPIQTIFENFYSKPPSQIGPRRLLVDDVMYKEAQLRTITIDIKENSLLYRKNFRISNQKISKRTSSAQGQNSSSDWENDKGSITAQQFYNSKVSTNKTHNTNTSQNQNQKIEKQQYQNLVVSSARADTRLSLRPIVTKLQEHHVLVRTQTSPLRLVQDSTEISFYSSEISEDTYYKGHGSPQRSLYSNKKQTSQDDNQEIKVNQMRGQLINVSELNSAGVRIVYSGFRNIQGLQSIMIFTQLMVQILVHKQDLQELPQLVEVEGLISAQLKYKKLPPSLQENLYLWTNNQQQAKLDGLDFIAQIQSTVDKIGLNIQPIYDAFTSQGNKLNSIYFMDRLDVKDRIQLFTRLPILLNTKDNFQIIQLVLSEKDYISDLTKPEICKLVVVILNLLSQNKEIFQNYINITSNLQEVDIQGIFFRTIQEIKDLQRTNNTSKKLEQMKLQIKQSYRKKMDVADCQDEEFVAEKRAEKYIHQIQKSFRNKMVEQIKSSNQKINNMYFIVGDVVQRNIALFRNQENSSFYKDPKHKDILEQFDKEIKKPTQQQISGKKEDVSNTMYYVLKVPDKLYKI